MTTSSKLISVQITRILRRHIMLPLMAGILLALLAPFGTGQFPIAGLFAFWIGMSFAGGLGAMGAQAGLAKWRAASPIWMFIAAMSLGATAAVSPFVFVIFSEQTPLSIAMSLFYIAVISVAISAVGYLLERAQNPIRTDIQPAARPPLMDRLPPHLRSATLFAVTSEDHYVRVFTDAGEHLTLMRLSDAEDLAAPIKGLKPHRSWWVAEAGVQAVSRENGKLSIRLKNGQIVPVSRSGAKLVRDANWI